MATKLFGRDLARAVQRADGWANALTGVGAATRDKRLGARPVVDYIDRNTLEAIWRSDDMGARVVERLPDDMLREGFDVKIQDDTGAAELLMGKMEDLCVHDAFKEALEYERAYGGGAILLGADDGATDLAEPLNENAIRSLDWMTVLAANELHPVSYYGDALAPKFGQPQVYQLHPDMPGMSNVMRAYVEVHESRLIRFGGVRVSRRQLRQNSGWGDSVFVRIQQVLADFQSVWGATGILVTDFAQAILKIAGLADLIATNQDDVVARRAQALAMSRSVTGMFLLDAEEDFERKPTPMTGLPDILDRYSTRLAAAADMPVTLIMGVSPAGLNATGQADIQNYYDRVAAKQHNHLMPKLARLMRLLMLAADGPTRGVEPDNWSIVFNPLVRQTESEKADVRLKTAQSDQIYITLGVASAAEVAVSRFGGDEYSTDTTLDMEGRNKLGALAAPPKVAEKDKALGDKLGPPLRATTSTPAASLGTPQGPMGMNGGPK